MKWIIAGAGAVVAALAAAVALAAATMLGGPSPGGAALAAMLADPGSYCISPAAARGAWGQWSAEQVTDAATIVRVGEADNVPQYGWTIAVATAMQESSLINLNHGDQDSLGLFQQRSSQGWGTPAQIMDPVHASGQFYLHLEAVPGWQQLPLTVAAQDVQHSGTPGAYAQWQQPATALVGHLTGPGISLAAADQTVSSCGPGQVAPGSSAQVKAVLAYAYSALGTMYDFGGSCTDPHSPDMALHCDCSSLVQQSFLHGAGLQMPRVANDQYLWGMAGHARVIPLSQAQAGDVVYFPTYLGPNTMGHTGIITNPKTMTMIEAPTQGEPVQFGTYNPADRAAVPYGSHMFTILRFVSTTAGAGAGSRS